MYVTLLGLAVGARSVMSLRASRGLHALMTERVLRAPTAWFDATPVGRIQNRFSSDFQQVDRVVSQALGAFLNNFFTPVMSMYAIGRELPLLVPACAPAMALRRGRRDPVHEGRARPQADRQHDPLARVRALQRVAERRPDAALVRRRRRALPRPLLRARRQREPRRALAEQRRALDGSAREAPLGGRRGEPRASTCAWRAVDRAHADGDDYDQQATGHLTPASGGLVLQYAVMLTSSIVAIINTWTAVELAMVSVERVPRVHRAETEAPAETAAADAPPARWPFAGELVLENLSVRYKGAPHPALAQLSLHVPPPRTKVGVVGRTGAGKSTLVLALLRILEPETGTITLDGVDISRVGLDELRSKVAIVPQEPTVSASPAARARARARARATHLLLLATPPPTAIQRLGEVQPRPVRRARRRGVAQRPGTRAARRRRGRPRRTGAANGPRRR